MKSCQSLVHKNATNLGHNSAKHLKLGRCPLMAGQAAVREFVSQASLWKAGADGYRAASEFSLGRFLFTMVYFLLLS